MGDIGSEAEKSILTNAIFSDAALRSVGYKGHLTTDPSVPLAVLGEYELLKSLGEGGMGTVYLAKHGTLGRLVALKTITRGSLSTPQEISRFRVEAEAAAKLDHPNIASIYEIGECGGTHYIAMQLIDGENLDSWRKRTLPSPAICAAIVRDLALAMFHAHRRGVIHRDLKPGNVMIDVGGAVRIVDFGLAKKLDSESQMTMTGQIMGTPSFMAPEQAAGDSKNVTTHADVYAIGAVLFYLLTGKPPFVGTTVYETLDQVQNTPAPSVRTINRRIPLDLSTICAKCLEKNPDQRYASANELAEDLQRFINHKPVLARRISTSTRILRWSRRNPVATAFMVITTSMLGAMTYFYLQAERAVADAQQSFKRQVLTINELLVQTTSSDLKNVPNSHKTQELEGSAREMKKVSGEVAGFQRSPSGNLDGITLKDGTEIWFSPKANKKVAATISIGDQVELSGWTHAGEFELHAATITNVGLARQSMLMSLLPTHRNRQPFGLVPQLVTVRSPKRNLVITESLGGFRYRLWCRLIYELWHKAMQRLDRN